MFVIVIISLVIYCFTGIAIYHNMYNYEKKDRIIFMIIGFIITFIITLFVCSFSSNSLNTNETNLKTIKNTSILLFSPINAMLFLIYISSTFNKYKDKGQTIELKEFRRKLISFVVVLIVVLIIEKYYINDFELGILQNAKK